VSFAEFEAQIETLARQIAEDSVDPARLALARIASEAELELSRPSRARASENGKMIARSLIFGALESPSHYSVADCRVRMAEGTRRSKPVRPVLVDPSSTLPKDDSFAA
jgi:hypothetical protein